ncbi:MAG: hypothetical protein JW895_13535, partial [Thermoleophilaceae bacterium]|nr:hypothetical protein [Thermoleophilaceae bacterium]
MSMLRDDDRLWTGDRPRAELEDWAAPRRRRAAARAETAAPPPAGPPPRRFGRARVAAAGALAGVVLVAAGAGIASLGGDGDAGPDARDRLAGVDLPGAG